MNTRTAPTQRAIPRLVRTPWPVKAMGAVVLVTLAAVSWQQLQGAPAPEATAAVRWERALHFEDRVNGDVTVLDAAGRTEVAQFQGEQGFLRGTLRVLTRERARQSLGPEQPFVLTGYADGRLILRDPATGVRIPLEAFGPANAAVFGRLRDARGPVTSPTPERTKP